MTVARREIVNTDLTRVYHCISRVVRGCRLGGRGPDGQSFEHRKQWIEDRLQLLAENFAIGVASFAILDNHLHVLVRLDEQQSRTWNEEEVMRRWLAVYRPRNLDVDNPKVVAAWLADQTKDAKRVEQTRQRLSNLGWFMKALKEPLARMANKEDGVKGTFWDGRYKSIAILDEEALLTTCAYIDLNPFAAGMSSAPETAKHTSIRQRVAHVKNNGGLKKLKTAEHRTATAEELGRLERKHWLIPMDACSRHSSGSREGLLDSFTLGHYLQVLDYAARLDRPGKARLPEGVCNILQRLETSEAVWSERLQRMLNAVSLHGRVFACDSNKLREVAEQQRLHHCHNLSPQVSISAATLQPANPPPG